MNESTQKKLTAIAENRPKIYNNGVKNGIRVGKQEILANSKYIEKTATGKVINLTDVSEVYHKVKVYGDGQEVDVYGKNFYDNSRLMTKTDDGAVASRVQSGYLIPVAHNTNYVISATNVTTQPSYSIKGWKKENYIGTPSWNDLWSLGDVIKNNHQGSFDTGDYDYISFRTWAENSSYGVTEDTLFQLELGTPTPYEPYTHQTITATPMGTEISSMCPNMTFIADDDIQVNYYSSFGMAEKELAMWNALTNYGKRRSFLYGFRFMNLDGIGSPKPGLVVFGANDNHNYAFANLSGTTLPNNIDCSQISPTNRNAGNMFNGSAQLVAIPDDMNIPALVRYEGTYYGCRKLRRAGTMRFGEHTEECLNAFLKCESLEQIWFEGVICCDINLQWSKSLDEESLVSLAVSLAHLIETGENPEGSNVPDGLQFTKTVTLSPESWAILDNTLYPNTGLSCAEFITTVKGWLRA